MRRPLEIQKELTTTKTLVTLTSAFESLASMRISQIKNQVLRSQQFFAELWEIYSQIRVDNLFRYGRGHGKGSKGDKELLLAVTAEGSFSGDIDQRLIQLLLKDYDPHKHDIIVIGHHGAVQLAQANVRFEKFYKMPSKDKNINVMPIVTDLLPYKATTAYYQTYISLTVQDVRRINLTKAVQEQGQQALNSIKKTEAAEEISEANYIFEPSTYQLVGHLERSMVNIILAQIILESKLAQYASRFRAMGAAKERAKDTYADTSLLYNRSKRAEKDERLKEIVNGLRLTRREAAI